MIVALRKRHRTIWLVLAVLLPMGLVAGWLAIPDPTLEIGTYPLNSSPKGKAVAPAKSFNNGSMQVFQQAQDSTRQLLVSIDVPLISAGAAVYIAPKAISTPQDGIVLGSLGSRGKQLFQLDARSAQYVELHLLIYDPIKEQALETLQLY